VVSKIVFIETLTALVVRVFLWILVLNPSKSTFEKGELKSAHLIKNAPSFLKEGRGGFGFQSSKAIYKETAKQSL
jgi:hypothetical protein